MNRYIGNTISGKHLNELLDGMPLLKFMNDDDVHFGMQYVTGDNLDILPFKDSGKCRRGGLYVTTLKNFALYWHKYGSYARRVRINPTTLVYVEKNKFKCDEIYLEEKMLKEDLLKMLFTEYIQYLMDNKSKEDTENFILTMTKKSYVIRFIEPRFLTQNILMKIVEYDSYALQYIVDEMKTPELLMEAVKNDGDALELISDEMRTPELLMEAVKNDGNALQYIEDKMRTPELLMEAVKNDGNALQYIEDKMRTPELLMEAVKNDGHALQYIKDEIRTPELLMEAVKNDGHALQYIKDEIRTPELLMEAVKNDGHALQYIKDEIRTPELTMIAIRQNKHAVMYVKNEMRTPEMIEEVNDQLGYVPEFYGIRDE